MEKELEGIRGSLDKMDVAAKSSQETQGQTLQFLQQDAEREIKYLERKLREDMTHWDTQLKDREKILQQSVAQERSGSRWKRKPPTNKRREAAAKRAERAESLLKEQEAKPASKSARNGASFCRAKKPNF